MRPRTEVEADVRATVAAYRREMTCIRELLLQEMATGPGELVDLRDRLIALSDELVLSWGLGDPLACDIVNVFLVPGEPLVSFLVALTN